MLKCRALVKNMTLNIQYSIYNKYEWQNIICNVDNYLTVQMQNARTSKTYYKVSLEKHVFNTAAIDSLPINHLFDTER